MTGQINAPFDKLRVTNCFEFAIFGVFGLFFFAFVGYPILAFSDAKYNGPVAK
jgi:hypothetical protein